MNVFRMQSIYIITPMYPMYKYRHRKNF
jgi:hypothetical protein